MTASATIRDPQSFNRYSYALNSPYKFTYPLGLSVVGYAWQCNNCSDSGLPQPGGGFAGGGFESCLIDCVGVDEDDVAMAPQTYEVHGATYDEAIADAKAKFAKMWPNDANKCAGGCIGLTKANMPTSAGYSYQPRVNKDGSVTITITFNVSSTPVTYLPNWSGQGFKNASAEDKAQWSTRLAEVKDHEDGHVDIARQEFAKTRAALAASVGMSPKITITTKGLKHNQVEQRIKAVVSATITRANAILSTGYQSWSQRDSNYDNLTQHGVIPRNKVIY